MPLGYKDTGDNVPPRPPRHVWQSFISAGLASSIAVTLMAPVERAKLILQVQHFTDLDQKRKFTGFRDVIKTIVKRRGILALWRGNIPSVMRTCSYQALNFTFKDRYTILLTKKFNDASLASKMFVSLMAGGIAGCTTLSIVYPLDFARTRMACSAGTNPTLNTVRGNIIHTVKTRGVTGLYSGFWFSTFGVFIYRAIYFGLYDTGRFLTPPVHSNIFVNFVEAEMAAIIAGIMSYPVDTVRRTMMAQTMMDKQIYSGSLKCAKDIYTLHGIKGFFQGAATNVLRSTGGAMILVLNELFQDILWTNDDVPGVPVTVRKPEPGESIVALCAQINRKIKKRQQEQTAGGKKSKKYEVDRRKVGTGIF